MNFTKQLFYFLLLITLPVTCFAQNYKTNKTTATSKETVEDIRSRNRTLLYGADWKKLLISTTADLKKNTKDTVINLIHGCALIASNKIDEGITYFTKYYKSTDTATMLIVALVSELEKFTKEHNYFLTAANKLAPNNYMTLLYDAALREELDHDTAACETIMEKMFATRKVGSPDEKIIKQAIASYNATRLKNIANYTAEDLIKDYSDEDAKLIIAKHYFIRKVYTKAAGYYKEIYAGNNDSYYFKKEMDCYAKDKDMPNLENRIKAVNLTDEEKLEYAQEYKIASYFYSPKLNDGKTYIFGVSTDNSDVKDYDFIISNITKTNELLSCNYEINSKPSAKLIIKKEGLQNATIYINMFTGEDLSLENESTIWLSQKNMKEILEHSTTNLSLENIEGKFVVEQTESYDYLKVKVNGKEKLLDYIKLKDTDYGQELWVLNDINNPLILKMGISFTIKLEEIK